MTDLLTLIRTIDPNDREACDELNARFWCWLMGNKYGFNMKNGEHCFHNGLGGLTPVSSRKARKFDKSIDALKAVQEAELEGWWFSMDMSDDGDCVYRCGKMTSDGRDIVRITTALETGYLKQNFAYMSAIYQAIQWKRENNE